MIAYYEAHPNEVPSETATVSKKGKPQKEATPKMKRGFSSRDVGLALGLSFGLTFAVIVVLYVAGALT